MPDLSFTLNAGLLLAVGAAAAAMVYSVRIVRRYVRIATEAMENQAWLPENGNGDPPQWLGEEVRFRASDGHPLSGVLMRAAGHRSRETCGTVIFAHEFGSDRSIAVRYCLPLTQHGFDVLAFDFRGHGGSPNQPGYRPLQWPSDRETADVAGAIAFVKQLCVTQNRAPRIALFGLSRGACSAILASAEMKSDITAIISDGAYSTDTATEYFMKRFATIFARLPIIAQHHPPIFWKLMRMLVFRRFSRQSGSSFPSVRKAIKRMGRLPILFIHGEKDSYIPFAQCQALYDLAYGPKSLWIVPQARHNQCAKTVPDEYFRRVTDFLHEHVAEPAAPLRAKPARKRRYEAGVPVPAGGLVPSLVAAQCESSASV